MTSPDPTLLAAALESVAGAKGRAQPPVVRNGTADVILDVSGLADSTRAPLEDAIRQALLAIPGVAAVRVAMTAEKRERRILAVASGKGGVGKSTIAANLAVALARAGVRVGLVDADIYGPSQPRLMAAEGTKPQAEDKQLIPVETRWGVPLLSMGQLVDPGQAIAWRGPMAASALGQLVDARWGDTELLVVDMPPGTGDVQLTMIQKHRPAAALIVSTPQDLALIDAARAIDLFGKAGVPIMGLIENMAGYRCPACGVVSDPFGHGGAEEEAGARGIPFLGRVPLSIGIRKSSDAGTPPAATEDPEAQPFRDLAAAVVAWLNPSRA